MGATEVWSQGCPTTATDYLRQEVDVSGYTGIQDLTFRVIGTKSPKTSKDMIVYFDNIRTWGSFNDAAHTTVDNVFGADEFTVYMYGGGFKASTGYHLGYYDGNDNWVVSEGQTSNSSGELSGQCYFPNYEGTVVAGTWHVVVYEDPTAPPEVGYIASDPNRVVEDSFEVTSGAIPEFPTVVAVLAVAGACFGIYYCMRRRMVHVNT